MPMFTACYTKIESGYMGQLIEWPEVISEGATVEECREMLKDAAREMAAAYEADGLAIPAGAADALFERVPVNAG